MKNIIGKGLLISGLALGLGGVLQAQPDDNNAPKADNPPNARPRGNRPNLRDMTPEQRRQAMKKMREQGLRRTMTRSGFADAALQDAVVEFADAQAEATQSLQEKARLLTQAVRNQDSTDEQIAALLADFRTAAAAEKTRRATALAELEAATEFSKKPRLDALLTLSGIIGDETSLLGGAGGGRGQMGGGGRGGRGGRGNGNGGAAQPRAGA